MRSGQRAPRAMHCSANLAPRCARSWSQLSRQLRRDEPNHAFDAHRDPSTSAFSGAARLAQFELDVSPVLQLPKEERLDDGCAPATALNAAQLPPAAAQYILLDDRSRASRLRCAERFHRSPRVARRGLRAGGRPRCSSLDAPGRPHADTVRLPIPGGGRLRARTTYARGCLYPRPSSLTADVEKVRR